MDSIHELLAWASAQGARVHKLSPSSSNPREFVVVETVEAGETVILIPQSLLIHAGAAFEDVQFGQSFRRLAQEVSLNQTDLRPILCLYLVLERARQNSSRWSPYIKVLPETYDDPFWWQDEQIQLLRGTRLGRAVAMYHSGLSQLTAWMQRLEQLHGAPSVLSTYNNGWALTEAAARWARSVVWSRSFTVRRMANGAQNVVAMVPVLDMIDHSSEREVVWHTGMDGSEGFQFVSLNQVQKGQIMTNNYGTKSSDELLLAYGFLLGHTNPADYFQVSLAHRRLTHHPQPQAQAQTQGSGGEDSDSQGEDEEQDEGGDPVAQQAITEEVQRTLALFSLDLDLEHQLTLQQPLPEALVRAAQLCLMHAPQLYLLSTLLAQGRLQALQAAPSAGASHEAGQGDVVVADASGGRGRPQAQAQLRGQVSGRKRSGKDAGLPEREAMQMADEDRQQQQVKQQQQPPHGEQPPALASPELCTVMSAPSAMHIKPAGAAKPGSGESSALSTEGQLPLPQELEALVSLHHQLDAKLAAMVSDAEEGEALHGAASSGAAACNGSIPEHPPANPHHTVLAVRYVRGQKSIIRSTLAVLEGRSSQVVEAAAERASAAVTSGVFSYQPLVPVDTHSTGDTVSGVDVQGSWTSIDPSMHLQQYQAWTSQHGIAPSSSSQGQEGQAGAEQPACLLQEVVCQRSMSGASASSGLDAPSLKAGSRQGRAGGRGPPQASRTLRSLMPQQQQPPQPEQPEQAGSIDQGAPTPQAPQQGSDVGSSSGNNSGNGGDQSQVMMRRVAMPQGFSSSIGIDSDHDPTTLGVRVIRDVQAGGMLVSVPDDCCFIAASRHQLVSGLMASAHQLLQSLLAAVAPFASVSMAKGVETAAVTAGIAACKVPQARAVDMLTWHLMHTMASAPACRVLSSDESGVQLLVDMLEDSPCGGAYQEAYENTKGDYHQLRMAAQAAANNGKGPSGVNGSAESFWRVLSGPSSLALFSWADHVVDRCGVQVRGAAASAAFGSGEASQGREVWVLAPVLAAIPKEVRGAVVNVSLQKREVTPPPQSPAARAPLPYTHMPTPAPLSVVVSAACAMSENLPLTPLLTLPSLDVEDIMASYGPEGLVWRKLLLQGSQGSQSGTPCGKGWAAAAAAGSRSSLVPASTSGCKPVGAVAGAAGSHATPTPLPTLSSHLLYELYICPGEEDDLAELKLALLTASGLGCVHYLSEGFAAEAMVGAALKICLAGLDILEHPLSTQVVQLHAALHASMDAQEGGQEGSGVAVGAASSDAPSAQGCGSAVQVAGGSLASSSSKPQVPAGQLQQQLVAAQTELLAMLSELPEREPICKAARKQLRQMVHDARKNTRRRLRQLEAVHAHAAVHPSSSCTQAMSPFGGSYSPLGGGAAMHEGVRLYLQALCSVLDDCAERIGLNRQSDSLGGIKKSSR